MQLVTLAPSNTTVAHVFACLKNLARDIDNRAAILDAGSAEKIVTACSEAEDPRIVANGAGVLANLARDDASRAAVLKKGGVAVLVQLCKDSKDSGILANVCGALANLAVFPLSRPAIVKEGAIEPLVELCQSAQSYPVLISGALALCALAVHEGLNLEPELATKALSGLVRVKDSLGENTPAPLQQPLKDAIKILVERSETHDFIV